MSSIRHSQRRRNQSKRQSPAKLNLVSLMDIFTILVFFLMVNSSEVEVLDTNSDIKLPDSSAEKQPRNQLTILVSANDVIVQGRKVAAVDEIQRDGELLIAGLSEELAYQASRKATVPDGGFPITVMGDRELPYWLLKKIMYTCQNNDYARIALAVNQVMPADPEVSS